MIAPSVSGGLVLWEGQGRCNWKCCNTLDCVVFAFLQLVQVRHGDSKYGEVENLFQQTMKDYRICSLRRTWSPALWQHFQLFVSAFTSFPWWQQSHSDNDWAPILSSPVCGWFPLGKRQTASLSMQPCIPALTGSGAFLRSRLLWFSDLWWKITKSKNGRGDDKNLGALRN